MKKIIVLLLTALFVITPFYSAETEEDTDWKQQGKKALEETGKFLKKAGQKAKEGIENASEITCYGRWVYQTKDSTTTLICNEDGTMEFQRKIGLDTDYWCGYFSATFKMITFRIDEAGRKGALIDNKSSTPEQTWRFTYSMQDDPNQIKIVSSDIPRGLDGTDFNKGVIFTKK